VAPSVNSRLAKVKAADLVDNSFMERLEKSGYVAEARRRVGEIYHKQCDLSDIDKELVSWCASPVTLVK
jgi:hypothetical protein